MSENKTKTELSSKYNQIVSRRLYIAEEMEVLRRDMNRIPMGSESGQQRMSKAIKRMASLKQQYLDILRQERNFVAWIKEINNG